MISVTTDHPVALDSLDHIYPYATAYDNSVLASFNTKLFQIVPHPRLLDIGCAGGGLVRSIILDGGFAVGLEGSDYSQRVQRAEWVTVPDNLFTADVTKPFEICENGIPSKFNVITSWEFFEHISEESVEMVLDNVAQHLSDDGIFIVSISTEDMGLSDERINEDGSVVPEGIQFHVNVQDEEWWLFKFSEYGFVIDENLTQFFNPDWVRGPIVGVENSFCAVFSKK